MTLNLAWATSNSWATSPRYTDIAKGARRLEQIYPNKGAYRRRAPCQSAADGHIHRMRICTYVGGGGLS